MKIEVTCCETGHSAIRQISIDIKKFLVFEPAWLWMVRCMADDGTAEVVWKCRRGGVYVLLCTKVGGKGSGRVSVFPGMVWVDGKPEIVEWGRMARDPFYVMVCNRTDLVEFSSSVLDKLPPVVLMSKVGGKTELVKKVMLAILNKVAEERRKRIWR
jgi:hypothetical protein